MEVKIEESRCSLSENTALGLKRYLSHTRSYFREGIWIREYFLNFFPQTELDETNHLYFDLKSITPPNDFESVKSLSEEKIPSELIDDLKKAIGKFEEKVNSGKLNFNEEVSSKEFTLPDPRKHPEIYLIGKHAEGNRLIILWGLESKNDVHNIALNGLPEILQSNFSGKTVKRVSQAKPKQAKPPVKAPVKEKKSPKPKVEKTKPVKKTQVAEKRKPRVKPVKLKKERKKFDWSKLKWLKKASIFGMSIFAIVLAVKYASINYLGASVVIETNPTDLGRAIIQLAPEESVLLPSNAVITANNTNKTIFTSRFPQPGVFHYKKYKNGSKSSESIISHLYANARNDFADNPVASLLIENRNVLVGQPVIAQATASYHESDYSKKLYQFIDWGDSEDGFEDVSEGIEHIEHIYKTPGSYKVTLLVEDQRKNWDYDSILITVHEKDPASLKTNNRPVPDVQITKINELESGYLAEIDFSGSYDTDGHIKELIIDWGDESSPQQVDLKKKSASHKYGRRSKLCTIQVVAVDDLNEKSKAAKLNLDFLSEKMNHFVTAAQGNQPEDLFTEKQVNNIAGQFHLNQLTFNTVTVNKKHLRFEFQNSNASYYDVEWNLMGSNSVKEKIKDTNSIDIYVTEGMYTLTVQATSEDGSVHKLEHKFSVRLKNALSFPVKMATWASGLFSSAK